MAECEICFDAYDDEKRIPLDLDCCKKRLCQLCIETRISSTAICPYCKIRWSSRSFVNKCKENTPLNLLSELRKVVLSNDEDVVKRSECAGELRKYYENALQENMRKAGEKSSEQVIIIAIFKNIVIGSVRIMV